jgi:hypothetical protein
MEDEIRRLSKRNFDIQVKKLEGNISLEIMLALLNAGRPVPFNFVSKEEMNSLGLQCFPSNPDPEMPGYKNISEKFYF